MAAPLRVGGVPEHFNLPWRLAAESTAMPAPGVVWSDMPGGTGQMMAALEDGDLDVVVALTEGAIAAICSGVPGRVVRVYTTSPLQWGVHTAAGRHLVEADLESSHRYAVSRRGSGSHLMAHVLADRLGFTVADDRFVVVGDIDGARRALAAGDADVFLWDRFMTSPLVASGELDRIGVQPTPWPAFVTVAHTDVVDAGRDRQLAGALDLVAKVAARLVARDDAATVIAARYGLAPSEAKAWLDTTTFDAGDPADPVEIGAVARRLVDYGIIDHLPRPAALTHPL